MKVRCNKANKYTHCHHCPHSKEHEHYDECEESTCTVQTCPNRDVKVKCNEVRDGK